MLPPDKTFNRRSFIAAASGVLVVSLVANAQRGAKAYRIGTLGGAPGPRWDAFRNKLRELGWVEGKNIEFLWRWSEGASERIPDFARELVRLEADVIVAEGSIEATAVKNATTTIPIVIASSGDPVGAGLVASLARPGGNVTGSATGSQDLVAKQVELLNEAVPGLQRLSVLLNPSNPIHVLGLREAELAASALRLQVHAVSGQGAQPLETAFLTIAAENPGGLVVLADVTFDAKQRELAAFALKSRLPAVYNKALFVQAGGLLSYGPRFDEFFVKAAVYVDKILRGAKPGDLPVEQPTKFELSINLKTAKALGLTIAQSLLLRADDIVS